MKISSIIYIFCIVATFTLSVVFVLKYTTTPSVDMQKIFRQEQVLGVQDPGVYENTVGREEDTNTEVSDTTEEFIPVESVKIEPATVETDMIPESIIAPGSQDTITFAGGCFWCIEAFFQEEPGVVSAVSGYSGGDPDRAVYKQVVKGDTGHREVVQVTYDTHQVSLERIMSIFWTQIDPTDPSGQFADKGFQYTTAIYYHNDDQKKAAENSLQSLQESGLFKENIVTKILPFESFFEAEEYHQDYYQKSALRYKAYKKASGRAGFIEEEWAKQAALEFLSQIEKDQEEAFVPAEETKKHWDDYTNADIQAGLAELDYETYRIVVKDGTESSFNNAYWDHKEPGVYVDVITGQPLFSSTHKYDSNTGWPSFWRGIEEDSFEFVEDTKLSRTRIEVRSRSGHLGHVFDDGPDEYGGERYCINSGALRFVSKEDMVDEGYEDFMYLFN